MGGTLHTHTHGQEQAFLEQWKPLAWHWRLWRTETWDRHHDPHACVCLALMPPPSFPSLPSSILLPSLPTFLPPHTLPYSYYILPLRLFYRHAIHAPPLRANMPRRLRHAAARCAPHAAVLLRLAVAAYRTTSSAAAARTARRAMALAGIQFGFLVRFHRAHLFWT